MKKLLMILLSVITIMNLASCSTSNLVTDIPTDKPELKSESYSELYNYLVENKYITSDGKGVAIEADRIDATEGYRFSTDKFGSVEIYSYPDDTKSDYFSQAKDKGEVTIYGSTYKAVVSKKGNIVLLYASEVDAKSIEEPNLATIIANYPEYPSESDSEASDNSSK